MNPLDPREVPTARKRSWPPPASEAAAPGATKRDSLHESLFTLLREQRTGGGQAPLPIVSRVVASMLRRVASVQVTDDATADVYRVSIVLWESLAGRPLPSGTLDELPPPSRYRPDLDPAVDALVARGLASAPEPHFATAGEMALALEVALPPATPSQTGAWIESLAREAFEGPAQPSIQITLEPGRLATAQMEVVADPVRSLPPLLPPALSVSFGERRPVILATAIAGASLLVGLCLRYARGDRTPPRAESPPVAAASTVVSSAPAQATETASQAIDEAPSSPPSPVTAPWPSAAPGAPSHAATARPPKAKRAPRITRDDVL